MGPGIFIIEVQYNGETKWEELARCPAGLFWKDVYELAGNAFGKKSVRFRFIQNGETVEQPSE